MSGVEWSRLRAALRGAPRPVSLAWFERHRRRFLGEYHEMKARSGAELFEVDGGLVWYGTMPSVYGPVEYVIRYHRLHPSVAPVAYVLSPSTVRRALPTRRDGRVAVLARGGWHSGFTAFDVWQWLAQMVVSLPGA